MLVLELIKAVKDAAALADRRLLVVEQVENGFLACFHDAERVERSTEQQVFETFAKAAGHQLSDDERAQLQPMVASLMQTLGRHRTILRTVFCPTLESVLPVLERAIAARVRVLEAR